MPILFKSCSLLFCWIFSTHSSSLSTLFHSFFRDGLCSLCIICGRAWGPKKILANPLKIPQHLAVAFGNDDLINLTLVCDFILHAAQNNVRRVTFYDPNGKLEEMAPRLESLWYSRKKSKRVLALAVRFDHSLASMTETANSSGLQVNILSRRHGKEAMVDVCKELSISDTPITTAQITRSLKTQGIHEVDFLVAVGCANTLHGFPSWTLRVAEIHMLDRFKRRDRLSSDEFCSLLRAFSMRDRRLGF